MARKSVASSRHGPLVTRSVADKKAFAASPQAKATAQELKKRGGPTEADLREIPELSREEFAQCYRIRKEPITARIDADVLLWLKKKPGKYQTNLNSILREEMIREQQARSAKA